MSDWRGNAFTLLLIGYTSTREITVRHSDWLYRLFSHVKIKRIDLYKSALWNKILVLCVIKEFPVLYNRASEDFKDWNIKNNAWSKISELLESKCN